MASIFSGNAEFLKAQIQARYAAMLQEKLRESRVRPLIDVLQTGTGKVRLPIFFADGQLKEWTDQLSVSNIEDFFQDVETKRYAEGYRVKKDWLEKSREEFGPMVQQFVNNELDLMGSFEDRKIAELLTLNPTIWDGTAFFANARPNLKSAAALDNILTGTGITKAQIYADLKSAMDVLEGFQKPSGEPFFPYVEFTAMIPSHLRADVEAIKTAEFIVQNETNALRGKFDYIVNPFLSGRDWYLVNSAPSFKFALKLEASYPEGQPSWNMIDEEQTKTTRTMLYYNSMEAAVALVNPLVIVKIDNA